VRIAEPPFEELPPMVEELAPVLADEVAGSRYVFFGHSLGALVAFAVCREFRRNGTALPDTLVVSGARAPHLPPRKPPIHDLPEPEFIDELRRMEGTPEEALANKELMEVLIPMLRADVAVSETYNHMEEPPLPCPIVAFGGEGDEDVTAEDVYAWRSHTSAGFEARIFPGGHFFMHEHETDVVDEITKHLGSTG
jgi:medium-chain acyl-[acyl-carrier-protein] hydrolase